MRFITKSHDPFMGRQLVRPSKPTVYPASLYDIRIAIRSYQTECRWLVYTIDCRTVEVAYRYTDGQVENEVVFCPPDDVQRIISDIVPRLNPGSVNSPEYVYQPGDRVHVRHDDRIFTVLDGPFRCRAARVVFLIDDQQEGDSRILRYIEAYAMRPTTTTELARRAVTTLRSEQI